MGMTFEQKGAYIDLLIFQFNNHHFTESQAEQVLSICFAQVWNVLQNKFKREGDFYFNERLRTEIDKRKEYSESRRINALHPKKHKEAYAKHMGNGNRNRNSSINTNQCASKFEQFWKAYPRKKSKGQAETAFNKINPDEQLLATMIATIEQAKTQDEQWLKDNGAFIPYPATWLNAKGWLDEIKSGGSNGNNNTGFNTGKRFIRTERDAINQDAGADAAEIARRYEAKLKQAAADGNPEKDA